MSRSHPAPERQQAERCGHLAEARAAMMLRLKGYRILDRRWKSPSGEIDLVIRRGDAIAFVEVKTRSSVEEALESISLRQRRRIVSAADHWLASNPDAINCDCRFDIVLVTPYHWPQNLPNAFASDDQKTTGVTCPWLSRSRSRWIPSNVSTFAEIPPSR